LNIHRYPGDLTGYRLLQGMANQALVISEPIYKPAPYIPDMHYVSVSVEEMADAIRYYLNNNEERMKIVNAGYRLVTKELTIENTLKRVFRLVNNQDD